MICFPNAKINLGLNVVSRRSNGYHDIETVFYPISLEDSLEIILQEDSDQDIFSQYGIPVDASPQDNLVMRALDLMRQHSSIPPLKVFLLKNIPFGAGLGGGSADASFMLKLLNQQFQLGISDHDLATMSLKLGADCPYFIYNKAMYATGVGEKLSPISISLKGKYIILVNPNIHVPTKDAFEHIIPMQPSSPLKENILRPLVDWKNCIFNDFEKSIFLKYPVIKNIKDQLYAHGAVYASMTGSGSSVFGIFDNDPDDIKSHYPNCFVWKGEGLC